MNVNAYLSRVGLDARPAADAEGLAQLQRAHRLAIAFENLDIPLGHGINLEPEHVFDKLVTRRRGGYCFEQNQLFLRALQALGFDARPLLARVWLGTPPGLTPPRTHTLNLVMLDGQPWIADAGFGGSYTPPMPLIDGHEVATPDGAQHRLRRDAEHGWMLERRPAEEAEWQAQYSFTADPVFGMDLVMANHYTATAYQTRFTTFVVASVATEGGFASLVDRKLSRDGAPHQIESESELRSTFAEVFGIHLAEDEVKRLKLFEA